LVSRNVNVVLREDIKVHNNIEEITKQRKRWENHVKRKVAEDSIKL